MKPLNLLGFFLLSVSLALLSPSLALSDACDETFCEVCCMLDDNDEAYCFSDALACPIDPHIDFENLRTTVIIVLSFIIGNPNSMDHFDFQNRPPDFFESLRLSFFEKT